MKSKKLAFIGTGNMAFAIIQGLLKAITLPLKLLRAIKAI